MKQPFFLLGTAIVLLMTQTACRKVVGRGPLTSETRSVSGIQHIDLQMDAKVEVTQDSTYFLEVVAQANIMDKILTQQNGAKLSIRHRNNLWIKADDIIIRIHLPNISALDVSGSGCIQAMSPLQSNQMEMEISGSGEINLPTLNAQNFDAEISGSGKITISSGTCPVVNTDISGSGAIRISGMQSNQVRTRTSGSGLTKVWATQTLFADISGSGDVLYRGNPLIDTHISGSGKVKPE
jgi:hypothetical protein